MKVQSLSVGPMDNNAYLVTGGPVTVLVDAAAEAERLLAWVAECAPDGVDVVVTTHRHHDHVGALAEVAAVTGARCVAGEPDVDAIAAATGVRCEGVWDGDEIGGLTVIGLVGHTPGGIALVIPREDEASALITGDSLFPGGPGRTTNDRDFRQLMDDLESKVFGRFDDDTVIWPGHGKPTTLGAERPHLAEWRERGW